MKHGRRRTTDDVTPEKVARPDFVLRCTADEDDALMVTHNAENDSWCFELLGSRDPVFFTEAQIDALIIWLRARQLKTRFGKDPRE